MLHLYKMNRQNTYWVVQITGWVVYLLVAASIDKNNVSSTAKELILLSTYCVGGFLLSHLLRKLYNAKDFKNQSIEYLIVKSGIAIIVASLALVSMYMLASKILDPSLYSFGKDNLVSYTVSTIIIFILWSALYFIAKFVLNNRRMVIENLQMESNVKSLEIKTIKNHLQPHFIFNALNSIRALVDENPKRAREAITQLSNILRSSIQVDKIETLPLKKELEIVKDYLSLERIRYEERLQVSYNIQDNTLELPIPPLLLQTLVENAIKHGIAAYVAGGIIEVNSFMASSFHIITIRNTGHFELTNKAPNVADGEGFGLDSSKERLQYIFGPDALLDIKNIESNLVELTIKIPLQNK